MNYLDKKSLLVFLEQGKTVEYWLGLEKDGQEEICNWIAIEKGREQRDLFYAIYHCVYNDKPKGINSVYNFSYVEPDDMYGKIIFENDNYDEILSFLQNEYDVKLEKFQPEGYIDSFIN